MFHQYPLLTSDGLIQGFELNVEAGRGAGKTTGMGCWIDDLQKQMPRSVGMIIGDTYKQMLTRTLPSLISSLETHGLFEGLHYFIGRKPPKSWNWAMPYEPPQDFDRFILFYNGMGAHLISQDVKGDGRGLNADWELADEAALLNKRKLDESTSPALRGSRGNVFRGKRGFLTTLRVSSTPITQSGFWFVDREEAAILNPTKIKHIKADCTVNEHNLPPDFLEKAEMNATSQWIFLAEYKNVRPKRISGGFYALFNEEVHGYNEYNYNYYTKRGLKPSSLGDDDCNKNEPLTVGVDWGGTINCMTVFQRPPNELRLLKDFYVLGDDQKDQTDLFKEFDDYYSGHGNKTIYMWYDNTGNNKTGITKRSRAQLARKQLESYGWKVHLMTLGGANVRHDLKHMTWEVVLGEKNPRVPRFRINLSNARNAVISMTYAKSKPGRYGIEKDKSSERSSTILRQHATDLSDAADTVIHGLLGNVVRYQGGTLPQASINSH